MSGAYFKHAAGARPRKEKPPVYGICPECGHAGAFVWAGAGLYRCHNRKCLKPVPREEIKDAPQRRASAAKQSLLFEEPLS